MGRYLGQHFLNDEAVISHAIQSILPQENGILEVGPGGMALTEHLIKQTTPILLIERDEKLLPYIEKRLKAHPNAKVIHQDILEYDFQEARNRFKGPFGLISNLPYLISTPFLEKIAPLSHLFTKVHLMLQKEVVEKVMAPNGKNGSKLSHLLRIQYHLEPGIVVAKKSFNPPPKVDSQFLTLTPKKPLLEPCKWDGFREFLNLAFNHRKHTLHWFEKKYHFKAIHPSDRKIEEIPTSELIESFLAT
ncbi:MAG: ribosomal RNA small subunit methyltransferase A [Chlamydiae bacterium]|nr:ribosomal RNA small subunit methyltransferase A [Chlamydiota bacterium]